MLILMKYSKWFMSTVVLIVISIAAFFVLNKGNNTYSKKYKVGIFEVVRHPVLDSMVDTFENHLKESLSENVEFVRLVPEGDASKTEQMAQKFATGGYSLVFVIGTNQAQSLANKTKTIPIVLGAITDPKTAGLVKSWEKPGGNITGTSDLSPISVQLDRMAEIQPKARRIGIIYNPAEDNSGIIAERFKSECNKRGLSCITATISNQNEIRQTLVSLLGKIDVLYAPTDATVQSAFPLLIGTANEMKIPVFDCDEGTVKKGAVFSVGFNYLDLGVISADMAFNILKNGKSPGEMPIRMANNVQLFYNPNQIAKFGFLLPETWIKTGKRVSE